MKKMFIFTEPVFLRHPTRPPNPHPQAVYSCLKYLFYLH
jgi:hypothetical protein